jgi:hypothetical protein
MEQEPILKRCRGCGTCSEKMDMCAVCKDRFQLRWSDPSPKKKLDFAYFAVLSLVITALYSLFLISVSKFIKD